MTILFASEQEINNWDKLIISNPDGGNVTQSIELANIKLKTGWKIRLIVTDICAITVHERYIIGLGRLWYIPKGPGVNTVGNIKSLIEPLNKFARKNGVFLIKIEPEIIKDSENLSELSKLEIISSRPIQANSSTVIVDISKNIDEIMTNLPQKSRHAINRAKRDGVITKLVEPSDENFTIMASLINQTMANKSVATRSAAYYKNFWKTFTDKDLGSLFFAYDNGVPIAGAFVLIYGHKATYKDGGSVHKKTIYGASHALQWCIIEWLKSKDIKDYDLCGTPSAVEINNKNNPYYGIGLFKTSFNKTVTEYVGVYDIVIRQFSYTIWKKIGERIIHRVYSSVLKRMFY